MLILCMIPRSSKRQHGSDIMFRAKLQKSMSVQLQEKSDVILNKHEPRSEKTGLQGFRPGPTQNGLYNHRR